VTASRLVAARPERTSQCSAAQKTERHDVRRVRSCVRLDVSRPVPRAISDWHDSSLPRNVRCPLQMAGDTAHCSAHWTVRGWGRGIRGRRWEA